jgi:glycosyltransferase involved in cell wall biosynthesis
MRLLVDYRPALRARTGVGEWVHNLVRTALRLEAGTAGQPRLDIDLFVSSWKDRPSAAARAELAGATFIDRRIPVRLLTWAWNRRGWPPVEVLAGHRVDVTFSPTPLIVPSRNALHVVTVHDLDFLDHPERTWGEMKRDFPSLIRTHVGRADLVVTISQFTAGEATRRLGIPEDRLVVCRPGVPQWITSGPPPAQTPPASAGYILFVGTLEPRKNVSGLLRAYARLRAKLPEAPRLVLAGGIPPVSEALVRETLASPLGAHIDALGYLQPEARRRVYTGASMLVLPSHMEGFGIPVLEAMALGVPVVVSSRGALPEVAGPAGTVLEPDDIEGWAAAMERVLREPGLAATMRERGIAQAATFSWARAVEHLVERLELAQHAARPRRKDVPSA